jgi:hypothetical protein
VLVRRKHWYLPCALGQEFESASEKERARLWKSTYWTDYISASEWAALLSEDSFSPSAKSRLKKKAAGWLIALGRMAALNPELFLAAVEQALRLYAEQTKTEYPKAMFAGAAMNLDLLRETLAEHGNGIVIVTVEPPDGGCSAVTTSEDVEREREDG